MSLTELLPEIQLLPRREKFRLVQTLLTELEESEEPPGETPIWSPYDAHRAAQVLTQLLEKDKQSLTEVA